MSMNLVTLLYLVASVCFIQALKGLSHPTTSRRGSLFGMIGMGIAILTTVGLIYKLGAELATAGIGYVIVGLLVGGTAGSIMAKRVEMTKMPELVAFMHSMIGLAAVFIAIAAVLEPQSMGIVAAISDPIPTGNRLELFLGAAIGAITFSGSVIAFGKLSGKYKFRLFQGAPVQFAGQHKLNLILGLTTIALGLLFTFTGHYSAFTLMLVLAFIMGVLIIIPIGGADMPVVVSMLNSYSGWAAAGIGFAEQLDADHRGLPGGFVRCHPFVHHVQGNEPFVLQRHPRRLWRRCRCRRGARLERTAPGQVRLCRRRHLPAEQR